MAAEFHKSLKWMLDTPDAVESLALVFSSDEEVNGKHIEVDLKPNGRNIPVTSINMHE